jgi:hypothetical protein
MMRRTRLPVVAALAAVLAGGAAASSGPPPALVTVDVAVEQPQPAAGPSQVVPWSLVRGLTAQDFDVFSDGTACPVESFSTGGASLSMVVLLDVSASTEITVDWLLDPLQTALVPALKSGDRVAFGRFGGVALNVDRRFSSRPDELKEAARAVLTLPSQALAPPAGAVSAGAFGPVKPDPVLLVRGMNGGFALGASPVWDAVDAAVGALESEPGRRAIILVTDGRSTGNLRSLEETILHAVAAEVGVLVVGEAHDEVIPQRKAVTAQVRPTAFLESMAAITGGAYAPVFGPEKSRPNRIDGLAMRPAREREGGEPLRPARIDEGAFKKWVGRTMAGFVDDLHSAYTIGFLAPALDGQLHTLDVRVRKPGLKVRARQRYVARPKPAA